MTGSCGTLLKTPILWVILLALTGLQPACQPQDSQLPQADDLESARFAANVCTTDDQCLPTLPCREARCANGTCRYLKTDPDCCLTDEECDPQNDCLVANCNIAEGDPTGICSVSADPTKEGCCFTPADCPEPPAGALATCLDGDGVPYKVCGIEENPGACTPPSQGIVINEFMAYAMAVSDLTGEWIELTNTGLAAVDLRGYTLQDADSDYFTLESTSPLLIEPGGFFVLSRSDNPQNNGGIDADYAYYNMILSNGADEIILYNPQGQEVDRVEYGTEPFIPTEGASFELLNPYLDNNDSINWAVAQKVVPPALDKGTPGAPNTDAFFVYYTPPVCNDSDSCTLDVCGNGAEALCTHYAIDGCCLYDVECDDQDGCTQDHCDGPTLTCINEHIAGCCNTQSQCNDSNICTIDQCLNHECRHRPDPARPLCCTADPQCKDTNPCTVDYCSQDADQPYKTCHHVSPGGVQCCNVDGQCDDGMPATLDSCVNHNCVHEQDAEYCTAPPPVFCNDNDPCTVDSCDLGTFLCQHQPIDGCCNENTQCADDDPCTLDICQTAVHTCNHVWTSWCCHQASDCFQFMTDLDLCKEPICVNNECRLKPAPTINCCLIDADCNDADACTEDVCNPGNHTCSHNSLGVGCCHTDSECQEDDDPCTEVACRDNQCTYLPIPECCKGDWECEDDSPCTMDRCVDYRCRYNWDWAAGCCLTTQDCPELPTPCLAVECNNLNSCVVVPVNECTIAPDWLETFGGGESFVELGWTATPSPFGLFALQSGTDVMGPDPCAVLQGDASIQGAQTCLRSPIISVQDPNETITVTFDHEVDADLSQTVGALGIRVTGRPVGLPDAITLAQIAPTTVIPGSTVMFTLPYKLKTSPFRLAFCADVPQGAMQVRWSIDNLRVGRGSPPRILSSHPDIQRLPEENALQSVVVQDADGDPMTVHLGGAKHLQFLPQTSTPGNVTGALQFKAVSPSKVGEYTSRFEVSDGFFEDHRSIHELIYVPKCQTVADCEDNNECTLDSCDPFIGCTNEAIEGCCNELTPCNDNSLCTQDTCIDGGCVFEPVDCTDDNPCTTDTCAPQTGCNHPFNTEACDDNDACTWHDTCFQGNCVGSPVNCADDLDCTLDTCDPLTGCKHKSLCTDSVLCTTDICTYQGCRSGKIPVGTAEMDAADPPDEWPDSATQATGTSAIIDFRMMLDGDNLYLSAHLNPAPNSGFIVALDEDFPNNTGVKLFSSVNPPGSPLDGVLTTGLEVLFPGFGADTAIVLKWGAIPTDGPTDTGCFALSTFEPSASVDCTIIAGSNGYVEVSLPWNSFYPDLLFQGKVSAAILASVAASGQIIEALPVATDNTVSDVTVFGVQDPMCLTAFCGDSFVDAGEQCDWGPDNSNETPDACRENCLNAFCGDQVLDTGEECDNGDANSDLAPDACREDCTQHRCGDGVTDSSEDCDDGEANADGVPDVCHTDCVAPYCGDGIKDSAEACDNGDENSDLAPDACRLDCVEHFCGDGVQDSTEGCDDGDANAPATPDVCRTGCIAPACGDSIVDGEHGEQCDNGDANSNSAPNACRENCLDPFCGDGTTDDGEECDDGNTTDWDGCNNDCTIYIAVCGDGIHTPNEDCDDGDANSNDTPNACREDCTLPSCGDGTIDDGETCDDGNNLPGDTCDADCTPYIPACGNGWPDPGEECDAGDFNSDLEPDACREDCTLHTCGDNVQDSDEQCDDGPFNNDEVPNACRTSCLAPYCGDSVVDSGEECDNGDLNASLPDHCKPNCIAPTCGDEVLDVLAGEECDWGPLNNDFEPDFCRENCLNAYCGDGLPDSDEECDNGNLNSDLAPNACRENCKDPFCGDNVTDSNEECDDGLDNSDFTPDACREDCTAPYCGDGIVDPASNEECDSGTLNNDQYPNMCRTNCLQAHCGDNVIDSGEECDDGNTSPDDGCDENCLEEVYLPLPGDVIITEIMQNPSYVLDTYGEYFEVYSTADIPIDLNGWDIDSNGESHTIINDGPLWIEPGQFLVLGNNKNISTNGGVVVDYQYTSILLLNGADVVSISFRGNLSDSVTYDGGTAFPDPSGASMELIPSHYNHIDNNQGANWCTSNTPLPCGGANCDFGTPGQSNPSCAP